METNTTTVTRQGAGRQSVSTKKDWCTPYKYVEAVKKVFGGTITLDPCSNHHSIVKAQTEYRMPEVDGLQESWCFPTIYVNPPYGNDKETGTKIKDWFAKCDYAHEFHHSEVIALVPVATNTSHWKQHVFGRAAGVCFLYDTRLKFLEDGKDGGKGAPMSCAMIYWGNDLQKFQDVFVRYGAVVDIRNLIGQKIGEDHRMHRTIA
jgi:DNA N-6-adenine-methyltransferase (Dam)